MQENEQENADSMVSNWTMEIATSLVLLLLASLVMYDSYRVGAGWGDDGPGSGYFPFYIGLLLALASAGILIQTLRKRRTESGSFVAREQAKLVISVFLPSLVYVFFIKYLGIYVASTIFIAVFMKWLGKYGAVKVLSVSIGVSVVFFLMFEMWFVVPLPKGPLESLFGY